MGEKLSQEHRHRLIRITDMLADVHRYLAKMPDDDFTKLAEAARACTVNNCWFVTYDAARMVLVEHERRYFAKKGQNPPAAPSPQNRESEE